MYCVFALLLQCITSQYQFSDDPMRKEFLDFLFAFLAQQGKYNIQCTCTGPCAILILPFFVNVVEGSIMKVSIV